MPKTKKRVNRVIAFAKRNRLLAAIIFIFLLAFLTAAIMQLVLYINFITGNDIVLTLNADRIDMLLMHGQSQKVSFEMQAAANPFCRIQCQSSFFYISGNETIEAESFSLRAQIARKKAYEITASRKGAGQDLYRFTLQCHNVKSFLCHTDEKQTSRNILVTVEYGLNESEEKMKQSLKVELESDAATFGNLNASLIYLNAELENLSQTLVINESNMKFENAARQRTEALNYLSKSEQLWKEQDYNALNENANLLAGSLADFQSGMQDLRDCIYSNISFYNMLVSNLEKIRQNLLLLTALEFNQTYLQEAEKIITDFNRNVSLFASAKSLKEKETIANSLSIGTSKFFSVSYGNETLNRTNETVIFSIENITLAEPNGTFIINLEEQAGQCCVFSNCNECCNGCKEKYPIIFLHGHDFNKGISAYYSLNAFAELQKALEGDSYLNAGEFSLSAEKRNSSGLLGMNSMPVTIRASYYFDVLSKAGSYITIQTKSEGIDTYAIRLKELVDNIKYETNQSKVIIIAHSMGGLVARRYIQIFWDSNVDKLILVNVPNKGITGKVKQYCSLFGSSAECRDMDSESLFINKLNENNVQEKIPIYNIVGTGCKMDEGLGDGIVLEQNAILENATNYLIEGQCSGINLLHGELLDISKYPEFYSIIKEILKP
jgi:hypothetical protein